MWELITHTWNPKNSPSSAISHLQYQDSTPTPPPSRTKGLQYHLMGNLGKRGSNIGLMLHDQERRKCHIFTQNLKALCVWIISLIFWTRTISLIYPIFYRYIDDMYLTTHTCKKVVHKKIIRKSHEHESKRKMYILSEESR